MATPITIPRVAKLRDGSPAAGRWEAFGIDCYVLDDGRRVLSQRGILKQIAGRSDEGDLGRYLDKVNDGAAKNALRQNDGSFVFLSGGGTKCNGREAKDVAALATFFVTAALDGTLPPEKFYIAVNATKLLGALATIGLEALVDEITGYEKERQARFLEDRIALYIVDDPQTYRKLWTDRLVKTMCQTFRVAHDKSKGFPIFLTGIAGKLYDSILSSQLVDVVRDMDPHAKGIKYFQHFTPEARRVLSAELSVVETLALQSRDKEDFWAKVRNRYEGAPYQLSMGAI